MTQSKQVRALVLASASPRRRDILEQLGVEFRVEPSGIDETALPAETPEQHVLRLARDKAAEVRARLQHDVQRPCVLAADTIVLIDGVVFGKPRDDADALRMLQTLSGRTHRVLTGLCVCEVGGDHHEARLFTTDVTFRHLDDATARGYIDSGEARDKAGAYAIQGLGAGLVRAIAGSYTNVVGMPAAETLDMLFEAGVLRSWP